MRKLSLLLGVMIFVLSGCGSKQNPFDGKPDAVKDGRLPVQKVQLPPPKDSDAVRINTADLKTFKEGEEGRIPIAVTVLEEGYQGIIEISNEGDFPGSSLDPVTNDFVWTPPKGFIFGGTQDGDILKKEMELKIRAYGKHATQGNAVIYTRERSIKVTIEKTKGAPTMTVSGLKDDNGNIKLIEENTSHEFTVLIKDEDAGPGLNTQPRLEFLNPKDKTISLAPFMKVSKTGINYKTREFTYTITLDTGRSNITAGYSTAGFGIRAFSRFGVPTADFFIDTAVLAKFGSIATTWKERIEMVRGTTVRIPFIIYEDTARAEFKYENIGLPEDAVIECGYYSRGMMGCVFTWKIGEDETPAYGDFDMNVTAHSGYSSQINAKSEKLNFKFDIIKPTRPRPPVSNESGGA